MAARKQSATEPTVPRGSLPKAGGPRCPSVGPEGQVRTWPLGVPLQQGAVLRNGPIQKWPHPRSRCRGSGAPQAWEAGYLLWVPLATHPPQAPGLLLGPVPPALAPGPHSRFHQHTFRKCTHVAVALEPEAQKGTAATAWLPALLLCTPASRAGAPQRSLQLSGSREGGSGQLASWPGPQDGPDGGR